MRYRSQITFNNKTNYKESKAALALPTFKNQNSAVKSHMLWTKDKLSPSAIPFPYLAACKVSVLCQLHIQSLKEDLIGDFAHIHTRFIKDREDAFMLLLHQVNNNLVVEVINLQKIELKLL